MGSSLTLLLSALILCFISTEVKTLVSREMARDNKSSKSDATFDLRNVTQDLSEEDAQEQTNENVASIAPSTADYKNVNNVSLGKKADNFADYVSFTTEHIIQCLNFPLFKMFANATAHSGDFTFFGGNATFFTLGRRTLVDCRIAVTVPDDMIILFQIENISVDRGKVSFAINEGSRIERFLCCSKEFEDVPPKVFILSNKAMFVLSMSQYLPSYAFRIHFSALPFSMRPQLEHILISEKKGYITSPGWDGHTNTFPGHDCWTRLDVPPEHAVMLTFLDLELSPSVFDDCPQEFVLVMTGGTTRQHVIQKVCGFSPPEPELFKTDVMHVQFYTSADFVQYTGFRLLYSFYTIPTMPKRDVNGRWNCSVPDWPEFQQHFPCNLLADCAEAEDEEGCPYTSPLCDKGHFHWGTSCYRYFRTTAKISWNEASQDCQRHGSHLVSLNDASEWRNVTSLLSQYHVKSIHTGLRSASASLPLSYRDVFQWTDDTVAYLYHLDVGRERSPLCSWFHTTDFQPGSRLAGLRATNCDSRLETDYVCERHIGPEDPERRSSDFPQPVRRQGHVDHDQSHVICPAGHLTHNFLSCDVQSACWANDLESAVSCLAPVTPLPPMFTCTNQIERVPYTLVCDHRPDCSDHSDEDVCVFQSCSAGFFHCGNQQCTPEKERCDGVQQCVTGTDELKCDYQKPDMRVRDIHTPLPPAVVQLNGNGSYTVTPQKLLVSVNSSEPQTSVTSQSSFSCPDTHFLCPDSVYYCLPVYVRCNGVYDCPGLQDEAGCDTYNCPGFYRCRASHVCLHPDMHLCDGQFQCPQHDDELFCNLTCPDGCTCYGNAFFCTRRFAVHQYPDLRFLEGGGSGLTPSDVANNTLLNSLSLAFCGLHHLDLPTLNNLQSLDLSDNHLTTITSQQLSRVSRLKHLTLAGNPLVFNDISVVRPFTSLHVLDLSRVKIFGLNVSVMAAFPNLQTVNLSDSGLDMVQGEGLQILQQLQVLDLRGCPMTSFPRDVFVGLSQLRAVYGNNYKLCCAQTLPEGFNLAQCEAPSDEISSCQDLLRSDVYRALLAVLAALALLGNVTSLLYRVHSHSTRSSGFGVFVAHLCVSDMLMGVYLAVIGVADRLYRGSYLWKDRQWKDSAACTAAGFLCLLSSEVSACLICLITLDRLLVLRFPFSQLRFSPRAAHLACAVVWCLGLSLAALPLLPAASHWRYYSQTGICIPLPITRKDFAGHTYSFGVMIVLNLLLFVLIGAGQLVIYLSIRANSLECSDTGRKAKEQTIARRLITIALSDFLCWFPVGVLGLLASNDVPIPGEVNVAVAILVLPLNSALNPFLYTLNLLLERRRRVKEERLRHFYMSQARSVVRTELGSEAALDKLKLTYTKGDVSALLKKWLEENLLSSEQMNAEGSKPSF
ncbi:hypothetical protein V1264_020722 [Littorina saxatilis]|uniref:G-protein coupled receptors family 1 profile domain-containing protein n=1 Tax=Littorina saxatilis TaxID=31220 RepID=A0AAN9BCE9_9CAEN